MTIDNQALWSIAQALHNIATAVGTLVSVLVLGYVLKAFLGDFSRTVHIKKDKE